MKKQNKPMANRDLQQERLRRGWSQQELAQHLETAPVTVSRWERGLQQPSPIMRLKLCAFFGKRPEELGFFPELSPSAEEENATQPEQEIFISSSHSLCYWSIPSPRNAFFTGREDILHWLHEELRQKTPQARTPAVLLSGLGGMGKTQTALEYVYRHVQDYAAIFWISAETLETMMASFVTIATLLRLPEEQEQKKVVDAVMCWLTQQSDWLLIFDNVEDPALVKPLLPPARSGSLLFTSRRQSLGLGTQVLHLHPMTSEDGVRFLLSRSGLFGPTRSLEQTDPETEALARELVAAMDGLPLALDQAGAYIEATHCSLSDYLRLFQSSHLRLLDEREIHADHALSVTKTFALAFKQLQEDHPAAAELLKVCAFLAPEAIPETFFLEEASALGPSFETLAVDFFAFHDAIKAILSYSLLQRDSTAHTLTIHRLVQVVLREGMRESEQKRWHQRVIHLLFVIFPDVIYDTWEQCERLLPHVLACATIIPDSSEDLELAMVLLKVALYLHERALYKQAEPLLQRTLRIREQVLGQDHPEVAVPLYRLAELYREQGKYEQAELHYERALWIREQALGLEHPQLAEILTNLANLSQDQGRYEQAELRYERALRIWEQTLGLDHPQVAEVLNGLALLYKGQGKYRQAESLFERALRIREQALGQEHPQVAIVLNNLALLYWNQGKYAQAEPLFERALRIREQALGPEHPKVAKVLNGLAILCYEQGKYEQAEPLYKRALHIWEQALGSEHPYVAHTLNNLALLSSEQGRYEQAEPLYKRALHIWEQAFGSEHSEVAIALTNLAILYVGQEKYEQAEPLYERALHIREQVLGLEHPEVAEVLNGLALLYVGQGKYKQAEQLYERALWIRKQHLGLQHPETAQTLHDLACFHRRQRQTTVALSYYQQALEIREQALGATHPKTERTRNALIQLLQELKEEERVVSVAMTIVRDVSQTPEEEHGEN